MKLKELEIIKWTQISNSFQQLFPELHLIFEPIFKKHNPIFYVANYPFGVSVINNGILNVPFAGKMHSLHSTELPEEIRDQLLYPHVGIPVAGVMQGSLECYINLPRHLIPLRILKPGTFFSTNSLIHQERLSHFVSTAYSYMSGSRSMLILPKISHEQYNERLAKNYTIDKQYLCPKTFNEQWDLIRELAQAPEFKSEWEAQLLLIPKSTYTLINESHEIKAHFMNMFFRYNFFASSQVMYDLVWSMFFEKLSLSIKNTPFILETVKHLIKLCLGEAPAYSPVINDEQGPMTELMDTFLNVYRIRYYQPAFMEVAYYNRHDPIYYSMQKHTFFCNLPEKASANRTIDELVTIKQLISSFKEHVLENKFPLSLENTILYKTLQEIEFEFYHPHGPDSLNTDIQGMIDEDPRFTTLVQNTNYDKSLDFPMHSLFFNGCIRLRPLKKPVKSSMSDLLDPFKLKNYRLDDK